VAIAVALANRLLSASAPFLDVHAMAHYADAELSPLLGDRTALAEKLERVHQGFALDLAVYHPDGVLLASAGELLPPVETMPAEPSPRRQSRGGVVLPIHDGRAYLVATFGWQGGGLRWALVPLIVLLVLALCTLPLARGIVRPIERITAAARALGEGDLTVRTGLDRDDEVGILARAFDDMATRLERLVENEKELLANVSHELRTPMARIRVALEIAEEGAHDPDALVEQLRGIRGDLAELEELTEQVLITARLDLATKTDLALRRDLVDVTDVAEAARARFADLHRDHALTVDLPDELPIVTADAKLLRRAIDNLLDNAAKYAPAENGPIELHFAGEGDLLVVEVADRGIGVDDDDLPRLFDPFFRSDKSRARGTGGVGLGLALCKRIVVAHGGHIEARPRDGGGLCVSFTVPL
jgi:two-component system OmpR family sensor kinase